MRERLNAGWHVLLILIGIATIGVGFFWPKPTERVQAHPIAAVSALRKATPRARVLVRTPGQMTYCPGPDCTVGAKARRQCEGRFPPGVFGVEPDFVCRFGGDVHRMVCDDIDDEHQCGMMSHSDLAYARNELQKFLEKPSTRRFVDVDFYADAREDKLDCEEHERDISCTFTKRSTGLEHPDSPMVCNWMGCGFPFAESAD